uniref:Selenoprotein F/M domain-containing protein n=1 Tax=Suricata suricatta TaxID=37032 RepID=A0A673SWL8_SURSU
LICIFKFSQIWTMSVEDLDIILVFVFKFSWEACREVGFSSNLLCSSCDLLGQFKLLQLDPDCRGRCQEEAQFETKTLYVGAILEVCG